VKAIVRSYHAAVRSYRSHRATVTIAAGIAVVAIALALAVAPPDGVEGGWIVNTVLILLYIGTGSTGLGVLCLPSGWRWLLAKLVAIGLVLLLFWVSVERAVFPLVTAP